SAPRSLVSMRSSCLSRSARKWQIIRGEQPEGSLPGVTEYMSSAEERLT
ncbi:hypothetical protein HaLaN_26992, partial [Haematococcus lacustris]